MDEFQVVMTGSMRGIFTDWLESCGLYLFQIPVEDDLPTYGIAVATRAADPSRLNEPCNCTAGMKYHALNCPAHPGEEQPRAAGG